MTEKKAWYINGYVGFVILLILSLLGVFLTAIGILNEMTISIIGGIIILAVAVFFFSALTIVGPNEAQALTFFGRYVGSIKESGLFITIPLTNKRPISLRVRNFNSDILKVNDEQGNPVEIAAVIVFRVTDTAKALFSVDYYEQFVQIQSEAAVRHVASQYAYDTFADVDAITLRGNTTEVSQKLTTELEERLQVAGVEIIETRLTHLAYATEIASAMLQRQQASAILAARKIIVEGAVSMTEDALSQLEANDKLNFDDERKMRIVNNLLVSIITDRGTQPVINTGETEK
ncbi:SPFH domain-containing protein [Loigolactobacillus zhaoyuanensis]|uniref:SPFH domain-containing protein n=1 Tax=Loigolactobacillus zhaoyuanensis TaxID=2486017 RepID=A0ABW8UDC3_9LACO|nr:SPFH domain-containing protein [Loigolactobacillus zhaoyuanensis]